jgi:precorrin-3B methylase
MTMTVDEVEVYAPSYIRTPDAEARDQGYTSVMKLRDDKESARAALRTEIARVVSALERARDVATVLGLREEFEAMIQTVTKVQERVTA